MKKKYIIELTDEERDSLSDILTRGTYSVQFIKRAKVIEFADQGVKKDYENAEAVGVSRRTVEEIRKRVCTNGFSETLYGLPKNHFNPYIDGDDRARLTAFVCEKTPNGVKNWSTRGLSKIFTTSDGRKVSHETITQALKINKLKPWQKKEWCVPPTDPEKAKEYVFRMEDVLDVYGMKPERDTVLISYLYG